MSNIIQQSMNAVKDTQVRNASSAKKSKSANAHLNTSENFPIFFYLNI